MKTINIVLLLFAFTIVSSVNGQVSFLGNGAAAPPGSYLGWDHPRDLEFKTNDILRMYLVQNQSNTINGWPGIVQDGHLGLSDQLNFFTSVGAASMIHINGGNSAGPAFHGFRPWMKYGMTVTSNDDLMYVGHKGESLDKTDAVISWADNGSTSQHGPDNLRFIFTGEYNYGGVSTSHTEEGQEIMRLTPAPQARVSIGNYSVNGLNDTPSERLDVDGTARLRQMPANIPNVLITGVEQDVDPVNGDYVLNYLEFTGNSGDLLAGDGTWVENTGEDCDWEIIENGGIDDVITGHGNECYPAGHVGIGVTEPQAKLDVFHAGDQVNPKDRAINAHWDDSIEPNFQTAYGIHSFLRRDPNVPFGIGIYSTALYAQRNFAGSFLAVASDNTASNVGIQGYANNGGEVLQQATGGRFHGYANSISTMASTRGVEGYAEGGQIAYGVLGEAFGAGTNWAGYFNGEVYATVQFVTSDEALKGNIQPLESAMDIIQQIEPKEYSFLTEQFSQLNLPEGQQQGVIAQELEEVLPNLVKTATNPAKYDSLGNEISASVEFKSVNYTGLIPYLIGGAKEQQSQIEAQDNEIAALQESLANQNELMMQMMDQIEMLQHQINGCCNGDEMPKTFGSNDEPAPSANPFGQNELYQNVPNPFRGQTTIRYTLEQGGRAMLNIHDSNGREIAQLENAEQVAGTYSYVWDATGLPAGTYHYSLVVDGELLVKRAIKLQD